MKKSAFHTTHLLTRSLIVFAYLLLQSSGPTEAQSRQPQRDLSRKLQLNFVTYTTTDGLPGNNLFGVFQDTRQFIWIRTGNGLSRYDGIEFQNFFHAATDSNSIAGNDIRSICEMPGDLIFVGTTNGLCIYNNLLNRFENWRVADKNIKPGSNKVISSLSKDKEHNLWINLNGELDVYDSLFRFRFRYTETEQGKLLKGLITTGPCFATSKKGDLWFSHDNFGLVTIESKTKRATCFKNSDDPAYRHENIRGLFLDREKSLLWYSQWGMGLYRYDLNRKSLKQFLFKRSVSFDIDQRNIINCILPYQDYLLCGSNDGLIVFDTLDESYSILAHDVNNPFSIPEGEITGMIIDKEGLLWVATTNGLCKSNLNKNPFCFLSEEFKETKTGPPIEINHFTLYDHQWIIIGTLTDGLYSYNIRTGERKHYFIKFARSGAANCFTKVFVDRKKNIWVSTFFGLRIYNLEKNRLEMPPADFSGLHPGFCKVLYQDSHLDYWISYEDDPKLIHCVNKGNSRYRLEKFYHENGSFPLMKINRIQEDIQGNIWISTAWSLGFLKWSRSEKSFTRYPKVKSPEEYLSESVCDLLPDHGNSIWIASGAGHGLISYNYVTNEQRNYTTENGLISNDLISLFKHNKQLWISTGDGISRFNPQTESFTNFSQEDGLPETGFTSKFVYDSTSNLLFAGTLHYIIFFNPDSTGHRETPVKRPDIYVKRFMVNGINVYHDFSQTLQLAPTENNVNIEFSLINYFEGDKIKYEYQLEGLEKSWNQSEKRRYVNYTNLDPGTYHFKVRITEDADRFGNPVTIASFCIATPFYFTWWFALIMTVLAASAIYIRYDYRERNRKVLVSVRERISRDLHDDIGSTLNSISIYSEIARMKNTEELQREKFLEIIGSSSRNMIEQINDIVWTVNPMNDKFENILLRMRSFVSELSEGKNLRLNFDVDANCNVISLGMNERKNFYLVFKEAVNNAIKYSEATEVQVKVKVTDQVLTLIVRDNGVGFDPLTRNGDSTGQGGNGLRNMKIRAEEIRGELKIDSVIGQGTTVELRLKV